jgi:hypothetical protein
VAEQASDSDPGFTVVDRRRRGEPEAERTREAPGPAASRPGSDRGVPVLGSPAEGAVRADLSALCMMLYSEALLHLGQVPDPGSGQARVDLDQARFTIDLLDVIQQKTQGNRTAEESAILEEMLAALRLGFVRLSRRG